MSDTAYRFFGSGDWLCAATRLCAEYSRICRIPFAFKRKPGTRFIYSFWYYAFTTWGTVKPGDYVFVHHVFPDSRGSAAIKRLKDSGISVITTSTQCQNHLRDEFGIEAPIVHQFVPKAKPLPKSDEFRVGILGRDVDSKNWEQARRVTERMNVPLLDWVTSPLVDYRRPLDGFWDQVSVVLNCAEREGGPLPNQEALARGRVSVSQNVGMLGDMDSDGVFIYDGSDESLMDALGRARAYWEAQEENPESLLPEWVSDERRVRSQMRKVLV